MKFFFAYIKQRAAVFAVFLVFAAVFAVVFALYDLPLKAVIYPFMLCAFLGIVFVAVDAASMHSKHKKYNECKHIPISTVELPKTSPSLTENDLLEIIDGIRIRHAQNEARWEERFRSANEYYSLWAHQIKTPISSMYLMLYSLDTPESRRLLSDLSRIERYVGMALSFLKLDSDTNDFVFKHHDIDRLIKSSVKSLSSEFIYRKLSLDCSDINKDIVTDEKWFCFVLEQLLSNALKYTEKGGIKIYMYADDVLCIEDTGIGIAPEDLPRIFENGYTGENGRTDKSASGIGLYLCRRICDRLGIGLSAESTPDVGTKVFLDLSQYKLKAE